MYSLNGNLSSIYGEAVGIHTQNPGFSVKWFQWKEFCDKIMKERQTSGVRGENMLRKICPVCEQVMTSDHYCKVCKKIILSPYVRDITYYLNESHPPGETDCEYHGRSEKEENRAYGRRQPKTARRGAFPVRGAVIGVFVFFVAVQVLAAVVHSLGYSDRANDQVSDIIKEEEFCELEEDEVKRIGERCSSEGHFSVTYGDLEGKLREMAEGAGYEVEGEETDSYNSIFGDGTDQWTSYSTERYYYLTSPEGGSSEMIVMEWDTATEELHQITLFLTKPDKAVELMVQVLEILVEAGELPADEYYGNQLKDEVLVYLRQEEISEGCWYEIPGVNAGVNLYVDGQYEEIYISIWKIY